MSPFFNILTGSTSRLLRGHNMYLRNEAIKRQEVHHLLRELFIPGIGADVVNALIVKIFENQLDGFWKNQDIMYDYKAILQYIS